MAENTHPAGPALSDTPDPGHDPPISTTSACHDPKKEDPDTPREPKRRKNCPKALDNIHESANFNFTFDTIFNGCTLQFTPKFGSFNLLEFSEKKVKEGIEKQEQKEEEGEVRGEREVSSLGTVDGVKGVE